jgi:hypothetical protein
LLKQQTHSFRRFHEPLFNIRRADQAEIQYSWSFFDPVGAMDPRLREDDGA